MSVTAVNADVAVSRASWRPNHPPYLVKTEETARARTIYTGDLDATMTIGSTDRPTDQPTASASENQRQTGRLTEPNAAPSCKAPAAERDQRCSEERQPNTSIPMNEPSKPLRPLRPPANAGVLLARSRLVHSPSHTCARLHKNRKK